MKTKSAYSLVRTGARAGYLLAVSIASLLATSHSRATDITLNGTPQTFAGTETGTSSPGVNGSFFQATNGSSLNLDGASYTVETTRVFSGTQGVLGMTPTSNVLLYTGEVSGFAMLPGAGGDSFSTAFSGTFTPQESGVHAFRWDNDDFGAMYIDLNADGIFQTEERVGNIEWHGSGSKTLTAGTAYNYIYMTGEGGGGESNNWWITTPGLSERRVNPSDGTQAGMWNVGSISYGPLSFTGQNLIVDADTALSLKTSTTPLDFASLIANDGTATITTAGGVNTLTFTGTTVAAGMTSGLSTGAAVTLGPVTIGAGGTLVATGSGTKTAASITLSGATGGITSGGTFNLGTYSDGGSAKTLTLGGTGTVVMDNSANTIVASNTAINLTGGTLDTTLTAVGTNDPLGGASGIQLANGKLMLAGQTTITSNALKATLYNNLPNGDWRGYIEFWSGGYDLRYQTPIATATETGAVWYRSNGSEGKKKWSDLFSGQADEGHFYVMWQGQYKPTTTSNKIIGTWEVDNDYEAFVKINGNWERWRDSWRVLDASQWYDIAITYANYGDYGSIRIPMHQSYMDWTGLDVSSGNPFGDFRTSSVGALALSGKTVTLNANSEISAVSDSAVVFGALTVNNGVLTLSGSPGTTFASTTISAGTGKLIGFNSTASVAPGAITGNSATGTFVKAGAGTLTLDASNTGLANMMFDVQAGKLTAVNAASMGGSTSVQLSGGTLLLSTTGGSGSTYNTTLDVTQNSSLTAGAAGGGTERSVTLGTNGSPSLTVRNGKTLTVTKTDLYGMTINDSIVLEDNATLSVDGTDTATYVILNNSGGASLTMGNNSTINLAAAGKLSTDKALDIYNLNLNGGSLEQTGTGADKNLNVRGTLTVNSSSTNLDLTGATLTTASNATIYLVNGTLTTATALNVGNLTVESGATLNLTGTGSDRDVSVGDRLRLAGKSLNTSGSTLSVGNRIELENSTLTTGNALTVNSVYMSNSTINPATALTVNGTFELYNNSSADFTGKTLSVGGIRMDNNATLTIRNAMTINGQIEIYNNSVVDFGSNVLTTNWQNLIVQGGTSELKAAGNLNINYLQMDGSGKLSVPSVTLNDRAHIRSTDSRYGNNVHSFSILENPGNPGRNVDIYGGGFDRNPWDGSSDIYFTGTNTYTGRTAINDNTVLVANDGVGMPTTSTVSFQNGVWGASGTITRLISNDAGGNVIWNGAGGFAAYGGPLTVSLATDEGSNAQLHWNSYTQGFNNQSLYLGSSQCTDSVTLTNNIEINSYAQINTQSKTQLATLSGDLTGTETLDKQGSGTLMLTGDNSGFSGRNYIRRGVLDVGTNCAGLGSGRIDLQCDTDDANQKGSILQANGTLAKTIGNDNGNVRWEDSGGGFAARGGALTVTLNGGATIGWNDDPSGFRGRHLMFGSGTADNVVTLTNNIDFQNDYKRVYVFDNPNSSADKAVLSGTLTNIRGFEKRGDGRLETSGFVTSGEQVRIYDGGTLKVIGNLRAGDLSSESGTDPRYTNTSYNNVENNDGKLIVTGDVQANWYYGGGSAANSANDITGNVYLRNNYEQNEGTAHIGGNLQSGENWIGVRNTTVLTVDGNIRSGAPSGSAADRDLYSWGGGRMIVGGDVAASRMYFEQGKAANGQTPGISVGGTAYISGEVDLRTGSSTFNNLTSNNVNIRYGADFTVNGNLITTALDANEQDYWDYVGGRGPSLHLNGTATINSGNGNINLNANNPGTGYGVLDGTATVSANYVGINNTAKLAGTLALNVKDKVEIGYNSVLAPGNNGVGTLAIGLNGGSGGNLQMNDSSKYEYEGGDMVTVAGTLTVNNNWTLKMKATGQRLAVGGSLILFKVGTLGTFDDTPTYDVSDLITAGWIPGGFDTGLLSLSVADGNVILNGIQAQPSDWTGGGADNDWQTAGNWGLAAAPGNVLLFGGSLRTTPNNNYPAGTSFGGLMFAAGSASFNLTGNAIALAGDISNLSSNNQSIALDMNLTGAVTKVDTGANNITLSGNLSGVGGVTKLGAGVLTLSGANTNTGAVTLSAGTLSVAAIADGGVASNLGAASSAASKLVFDGGALQYTGAGSTSDRAFTINTGKTAAIEVTNVAANLTLAGGTASSTGSLAKTGPGTLTLTGAQAFTGGATVDGGKLAIGNGGSGASLGSDVVLSNNANLTFNQADDSSFGKAVSGSGSFTKDGAGTLTMMSAQTYDGATVVSGGGTLKLTGMQVISGFGGDGTGWTLNNAGIDSDVISMNQASAFRNTKVEVNKAFTVSFDLSFGGATNVADAVTFFLQNSGLNVGASDGNRYGAGISPSALISIDTYGSRTGYGANGAPGAWIATSGSFSNGNWGPTHVELSYDGSNIWTQTMTNGADTFTNAYTVGSLATQVGDTTAYIGFNGTHGGQSNTYYVGNFSYTTGSTGSNLLPVTTNLTVAASSTFDLAACNQQVAALAGVGSVTNSASGPSVLTLSPASGSATFSGVIGGGTAAISLVKDGAGTQVLSGANTYTGDTTVSGGTLNVQGSLASAQTTVAGTLGGNGSISGTVTLSVGGSLGAKISNWGGTAGSGFEDLAVGALDIASGSHTISLDTTGMSGFSESNKTFRILTTGTGITGFSAGDFTVVATGFSGTGTWAVQETSGALEIVYTASGGLTPYQTWASGTFANAFTETAPDQDQDLDTHKNVMEYGFGTDPTLSSSNPLAYHGATLDAHGQPILVKEGGVYYAVYGRRRDHATAGLTYTVQFSAEMNPGQWVNSTDAPSEPFASDATIEVVKVPYPSGLIQSAPGQFRKARFFRVEVTQQ